jgi:hypothetical protein
MRHFSKKLDSEFFEDLKSYIASFTDLRSAEHQQAVIGAFEAMDECYEATRPLASMQAPKFSVLKEETCQIVIPDKKPSFCENLFKIIDERGLKDSKVYKNADIDRRLFSKMRSDFDYHPSKNTAIRLCLALGLDIAQTENLLESAGYCLSLSDTSDLVVRYCIEHNTYDIVSVNEAIDYFSGKLI